MGNKELLNNKNSTCRFFNKNKTTKTRIKHKWNFEKLMEGENPKTLTK